jgi:hypothetical protein
LNLLHLLVVRLRRTYISLSPSLSLFSKNAFSDDEYRQVTFECCVCGDYHGGKEAYCPKRNDLCEAQPGGLTYTVRKVISRVPCTISNSGAHCSMKVKKDDQMAKRDGCGTGGGKRMTAPGMKRMPIFEQGPSLDCPWREPFLHLSVTDVIYGKREKAHCALTANPPPPRRWQGI